MLVVVVDDLGCADLGVLGATDLQTPNLDRLARESALLTNWYSNAPVCAPARASILSGRFSARAGVATNGRNLTAGIPTLGKEFRAAGYRTAAIGKWHLGMTAETHPNAHGFDKFYGFLSGCIDFYSHRFYWGEPGRPNYHDLWRNREEAFEDGRYFTERITEETVSFLEQTKGERFCAYVAYNAPHYPMHAPEKYMQRFKGLPLERRTYAAMMAAVDDGVGAIRRTLEAQGQWENTIVAFTGDNGATTEKRAGLNNEYARAGSNGVYRGYKFSVFDGGTHVPGFVHWKGKIRARKAPQLGQAMDLLPTLLEAAALPTPGGMDGKSLWKVLRDDTASPREELFWMNQGQVAVRRGPWKLVVGGKEFGRSPEGNQALAGQNAMFLSRLDEDPGETKNLRAAHPQVVDELATMAEKWRLEQIKAGEN
ncbi:MAG: sulfatase [Acidobacteria bacterium]|nr:sulfatase [Acidobacteriota bacterium]